MIELATRRRTEVAAGRGRQAWARYSLTTVLRRDGSAEVTYEAGGKRGTVTFRNAGEAERFCDRISAGDLTALDGVASRSATPAKPVARGVGVTSPATGPTTDPDTTARLRRIYRKGNNR